MKRHWSQIAKLPVQLNPGSTSLGRLNGVFIHPDTGQVMAFLVGVLKVLVPIDVRKWGSQALLITEAEALIPPTDLYRLKDSGLRRSFLNGKRVRSKQGYNFGVIRDFQLDLTLNQLLSFEVSKRFLGIEWAKRQFTFKDIDHVTEKAIILAFEPENKKRIKVNNPIPST